MAAGRASGLGLAAMLAGCAPGGLTYAADAPPPPGLALGAVEARRALPQLIALAGAGSLAPASDGGRDGPG